MKPALTPNSSLTAGCNYNGSVTPPGSRGYLQWLAVALIFAVVTALMLLVLPGPHRRVHYMIAGTAGTAALMVVVFIILFRRKPGGE
jgi:hypothetical protein